MKPKGIEMVYTTNNNSKNIALSAGINTEIISISTGIPIPITTARDVRF